MPKDIYSSGYTAPAHRRTGPRPVPTSSTTYLPFALHVPGGPPPRPTPAPTQTETPVFASSTLKLLPQLDGPVMDKLAGPNPGGLPHIPPLPFECRDQLVSGQGVPMRRLLAREANVNPAVTGLIGADTVLPFRKAPMTKFVLRIMWPGYSHLNDHFVESHVIIHLREETDNAHVSYARLGKQIAEAFWFYMSAVDAKQKTDPNFQSTDPRWIIGENGIQVSDLILLKIRHICGAVWHADVAVDFGRFTPKPSPHQVCGLGTSYPGPGDEFWNAVVVSRPAGGPGQQQQQQGYHSGSQGAPSSSAYSGAYPTAQPGPSRHEAGPSNYQSGSSGYASSSQAGPSSYRSYY